MSLWQSVANQFGRPSGLPGRLAGYIMAHRSSNLERNEWVVSILDIEPQDQVLEIGFGPGVTIKSLAEIATQGCVWGIEHSELMLKKASGLNKRAIDEGRVRLELAPASDLPRDVLHLDKSLAVNVYQFWSDPQRVLKGIFSALKPGGTLALAEQPRKPGSTEQDVDLMAQAMSEHMRQAGFLDIVIRKKPMQPISTACVLGRKPE